MNDHNVTGWERTLSLAVGVAGVASGFRRGGVVGLFRTAASLMALKRGLTGHCAMKSALSHTQAQRSQALSPRPLPGREADVGVPGGAYNVQPSDVVPGSDPRLDNRLGEALPARDGIAR